jgi:hypothetical protein
VFYLYRSGEGETHSRVNHARPGRVSSSKPDMKALDFSATIIPEPRDRIEAVTPDTTHLKQNRDTINKPKSSASLIGSNEETKIAAGKHRDQRSRFLAQCFPYCFSPFLLQKEEGAFLFLAWDSPTAECSEKQTNTTIVPRTSSGRGRQGRPEGSQRGGAAESSGGVSRDDPPSRKRSGGALRLRTSRLASSRLAKRVAARG